MPPKKLGPKKRPKAKPKPGVRETTGDGPIMTLVREIVSEMKTFQPEITAGWCANVEATAAAMEAGATVQEWLGTTAAEAQLTMKAFIAEAFIAEMGVRAIEGHGAQWRNWSRVFSIRDLAKLYPDAALSEEITGMEAVVPQNAELHTLFTTPRATRDALEASQREQDEVRAS